MILKALSATLALAIIVFGYLAFSPGVSQSLTQIDDIFGTQSVGGVTVASFVSNQFALYSAAFVIAVIAVAVLFMFYAPNSDEQDTGGF